MKILIAVTHLLGAGHLTRAVMLGRAFAQAGHQVTVMSGGRPSRHIDTSGMTLFQLPPLASDGTDFATLLQENGTPADRAYLDRRTRIMLDKATAIAPDILITELFPFGRRVLSDEFTALLDAVRALPEPPLVLASVRDILAPPSKPARAETTREILRARYDGVLVHSDPAITTLDMSWPVTDEIGAMLHYTGFVAPARPVPGSAGAGRVLVSAGGGAVGASLFNATMEAARLTTFQWHALVGGADPHARIAGFAQAGLAANLTLEPVRPDFRQMLMAADCSVSMCGYNTAMDLLQTGIPAIIVPFDDGGEVEQTLRATALNKVPGIVTLPENRLTGATLAQAVTQVRGTPRRPLGQIRFDGANETVRIATKLRTGRA